MRLNYEIPDESWQDNRKSKAEMLPYILEFIESGKQAAEIISEKQITPAAVYSNAYGLIKRNKLNCRVASRNGRVFLLK